MMYNRFKYWSKYIVVYNISNNALYIINNIMELYFQFILIDIISSYLF